MKETERHITQTNDESRDNRYETMRVSGGDEPMGERSQREEHSDIEKREERRGEGTRVWWLGGRQIEELEAAVDAIVWFPELTPCVCLGRAFYNLPSPPHRRVPRKRVHGSRNPPSSSCCLYVCERARRRTCLHRRAAPPQNGTYASRKGIQSRGHP